MISSSSTRVPQACLAAVCLFASHSFLLAEPAAADAKVTIGTSATDAKFRLAGARGISTKDAAAKAKVKIVAGKADPNSASLDVLHDGKGPQGEDEPDENFFFNAGEPGGRFTMDLGSAIEVKGVTSFSWHAGTRAAQVYKLYGADGTAAGFKAEPGAGTDPATVGWKLIASVDTHDKPPGQHVASIAAANGGSLGKYRHLLFDCRCNPDDDVNGNTFFSEIDVADMNAPAGLEKTYASKDGKFHYILDSTEAPDLAAWFEGHVVPAVEEWYPKIIALMPVEGITPPDTIHFILQDSTPVEGATEDAPGYTEGNTVTLNTAFMREHEKDESVGCVIHEIVHVVQFGDAAHPVQAEPPAPDWVTEGVADYIRWYLFEPQSHGADISAEDAKGVVYNDSYRVTANFFDWVVRTSDKDLIRHLNTATHKGYTRKQWQEWTGTQLGELGSKWKAETLKNAGVK